MKDDNQLSDIHKDFLSSKNENSKVNINDLLQKVRLKQKREKKENAVFLSLVCGVVAVTGIIASL